MKKFGAALILFFILIALFHGSVYVINNHIAKTLERQLLSCPLPPNSEIVDSASVAGKMEGNGNGMQWFGILLIRSEMSENELSQWYNDRIVTGETDDIYAIRQESPEIFGYGNYCFEHYSGEDRCCQVRLFRDIAVGTESSIWESILNCDLRGH